MATSAEIAGWYSAFRDLAPFIAAVGVIVGAVFAYKQAERQRIKEGTNPTMIARTTGDLMISESACRDLMNAITLLTSAITDLSSRLEIEEEERIRRRDLQFIVDELRRQGEWPEMKPRKTPPR